MSRMSINQYYNDLFKCGNCGHSIDMHGVRGCRVTKLDTNNLCDCDNYIKGRRSSSTTPAKKRGRPPKQKEDVVIPLEDQGSEI